MKNMDETVLHNDRKKDIVKSAQYMFAEYGLEASSISQLAENAGVADSMIYHYFKNKEDLLFFALADKMVEVEKALQFHLEGVIDPVSRLGKVIWFHLWLNDFAP